MSTFQNLMMQNASGGGRGTVSILDCDTRDVTATNLDVDYCYVGYNGGMLNLTGGSVDYLQLYEASGSITGDVNSVSFYARSNSGSNTANFEINGNVGTISCNESGNGLVQFLNIQGNITGDVSLWGYGGILTLNGNCGTVSIAGNGASFNFSNGTCTSFTGGFFDCYNAIVTYAYVGYSSNDTASIGGGSSIGTLEFAGATLYIEGNSSISMLKMVNGYFNLGSGCTIGTLDYQVSNSPSMTADIHGTLENLSLYENGGYYQPMCEIIVKNGGRIEAGKVFNGGYVEVESGGYARLDDTSDKTNISCAEDGTLIYYTESE